jgi:hypothetical protein
MGGRTGGHRVPAAGIRIIAGVVGEPGPARRARRPRRCPSTGATASDMVVSYRAIGGSSHRAWDVPTSRIGSVRPRPSDAGGVQRFIALFLPFSWASFDI